MVFLIELGLEDTFRPDELLNVSVSSEAQLKPFLPIFLASLQGFVINPKHKVLRTNFAHEKQGVRGFSVDEEETILVFESIELLILG